MATPAYARALEYHLYSYRRIWRGTAVTSFLTPILYLAAMGIGLGRLVDSAGTATDNLGGLTYVVFLAPGLLAATAMQTAAGEATWPVLGALKWVRTYHAQAATPLGAFDIGIGHLLYIAIRALLSSVVFLAVMVLFGAADSWAVLLAVPAAVLTGMAFACPIAAYAVSRESEHGFAAIFRFVVIPMFLFSGVFFPISQLPAVIQPIAWLTPLWHGVELCRGLALGLTSTPAMIGHFAYLLVLVAAGTGLALHQYRRRLEA
jgi:lipooligosaccharide transport system permease protein